MSKLNFGLDPSVYLAFVAQLCSGSSDATELVEHAESLLASVAAGDYTIIDRNAAAFVIANQMTAQAMLQKALQAETPEEARKWMNLARDVVGMNSGTKRYVPNLTPPSTAEPTPAIKKSYWDMTPDERIKVDRDHKEELIRKGWLRVEGPAH